MLLYPRILKHVIMYTVDILRNYEEEKMANQELIRRSD